MSTPFHTFYPGDIIEDVYLEQYIKPIQDLEEGKTWYAEASGSASDIEVELDPAPSEYSEGMLLHLKITQGVSSEASLNVNGLGRRMLVKDGNAPLRKGDIAAGQVVSVVYDGSSFQLLSPTLIPTVFGAGGENLLVYSKSVSEVVGSETELVRVGFSQFNFDASKKYILEMKSSSASTTQGTFQLEVTDGNSSYLFPAGGTLQPNRQMSWLPRYRKTLPNLSGLHYIVATGHHLGAIEINIYEHRDTLVYADFTPAPLDSSINSYTLDTFTAEPGRTYSLTMRAEPHYGAQTEVSCYLEQGGSVYGIPHSDPTSEVVKGPYYSGELKLTKFLQGLSGVYNVHVRVADSGGVSIEIRDITED